VPGITDNGPAPRARHDVADVVVIGDGIIGLSTALELAHRGARCRVYGAANAGVASLAAAGLLAPSIGHLSSDVLPFYHASLAGYPSFLRRLDTVDPELALVVGLIDTSDSARDRASDGPDPAARWLTANELASVEPALAAPHGGALYEQEAAVDNVRLVAALRAAVRREPRIELSLDDPVAGVEVTSSSASAVCRSGTRVSVESVILAAGAWSSAIGGLPRSVPIEPLKGQMLALGGAPLRRSAMSADVYLVPRGAETLVGATVERAGFDVATDERALEALRRAAIELCPALASTPVTRAWAGVRPATPDLRPIIGHDPDYPRLIYACGHSKNGILLAPATAEAVACLALGLEPAHDLEPFSIARFGANKTANLR
jgi:glycine/D-amino acid oxidase-like deaminating enzyme